MGKGYDLAVERIFLLRNYLAPVDFTNDTSLTGTISHNLERGETLLAKEHHVMIHSVLRLSIKKKAGENQLEAIVTDAVSGGKTTDWGVSEHSQTKLTIVDYHEYPNKKVVTKAITGMDVVFSGKNGRIFPIKKKSDLKNIHAIVIT